MMLNYKEWYLVETYSRLVNAIGPERAATTILEMGEHLDEAEQELISRGMEPSLAQRAAFDRMGTPKQVAEAFVINGTRANNFKWSLALVAILLVFLGCAQYLGWSGLRYTAYLFFLIAVPLVVLLLSKRPLHWVAMTAGTLAICAFLMIDSAQTPFVNYQGFTPYQKIRSDYLALNKEHGDFLRIESGVAAKWRALLASGSRQGLYVVPDITYVARAPKYSYWRVTPSTVVLSTPDGRSKAEYAFVPIVGLTRIPAGEVDGVIATKFAEVRSQQRGRTNELRQRSETLNTSFKDRATANMSDVYIFIWGSLTSWLVTFCLSRAYVKVRTRARRLA